MSRTPPFHPTSPTSRRQLVFIVGISLLAACGDSATAPISKDPSSTANPLLGIPGCDGSRAPAQLTPSNGITLMSSFGNAQSDAAFNAEVSRQAQFWGTGVRATVRIINDGGPKTANAWSTSTGYILFGYYFFNVHLQQHGGVAIDGTLAHEWGHRAQYTFGWSESNPTVELEADAFSGYYMALGKQRSVAEVNSYYEHVTSIGDYLFNNPLHHGTPRQRVAAAYLGVTAGVQAMNNRQAYTYAQLHQFFMQQIAQQILPNRDVTPSDDASAHLSRTPLAGSLRAPSVRDIVDGRSQGDKVTYPHLTAEELAALRPREPSTTP